MLMRRLAVLPCVMALLIAPLLLTVSGQMSGRIECGMLPPEAGDRAFWLFLIGLFLSGAPVAFSISSLIDWSKGGRER